MDLKDSLHGASGYTECTKRLIPLLDIMDFLRNRWKFVILLALWFSSTAAKKNAGGSISCLPTIGRFAKVSYFYLGKKEYSISATNKHLWW